MFRFTIRGVEANAVRGRADEVRGLRCPQCGLGLSIAYIAGKRPTVAIRCVNQECMTAMFCDGVKSVPPWVADAGESIITGGNVSTS